MTETTHLRSALLADYGIPISKIDRLRRAAEGSRAAAERCYEQIRAACDERNRAAVIFNDLACPWRRTPADTLDIYRREVEMLRLRVASLNAEAKRQSAIAASRIAIANQCTDTFLENFPAGHYFGGDVRQILNWI